MMRMNCSVKATILIPKLNSLHLHPSLFHSTPVLERKRRNSWVSSSSVNSRRNRGHQSKKFLLHNLNVYAESLFKSWEYDFDKEIPSSSRSSSWFRKEYSKGSKRDSTGKHGSPYSKGSRRDWTGQQGGTHGRWSFNFCEDDFDIETAFRSAFGSNRFFYWSFINEENPQWRNFSNYSDYYGHGRNRRFRFEDDSDEESESDSPNSDSSNRLALGLSASGPLRLEDVKTAYRACALKWHPDRHQGSSKAIAEEKFKLCCAAYQSLCDKLTAA